MKRTNGLRLVPGWMISSAQVGRIGHSDSEININILSYAGSGAPPCLVMAEGRRGERQVNGLTGGSPVRYARRNG
jgi:hypothetical protein